MFSSELWAKIPVGVVLLIMILLISWCVGTTVEAKTDFSALVRFHVFKDHLVKLTRSLRGKTTEPGLDVGDAGGEDGQGTSGVPSRTGSLKEAFRFSRHWRLRRNRASTTSTLVNPMGGSNGPCGPLDGTGVEMDEVNSEVLASAV